ASSNCWRASQKRRRLLHACARRERWRYSNGPAPPRPRSCCSSWRKGTPQRAGHRWRRRPTPGLPAGRARRRWRQRSSISSARRANVAAGTLARLGTVRLQNSVEAALSPDGKTLVTVADKVLHLWDTTTGRELPGFPQSKKWDYPRAVAISPNGSLLA